MAAAHCKLDTLPARCLNQPRYRMYLRRPSNLQGIVCARTLQNLDCLHVPESGADIVRLLWVHQKPIYPPLQLAVEKSLKASHPLVLVICKVQFSYTGFCHVHAFTLIVASI